MGREGESVACVDGGSWRSWALALTPVPVADVSSPEDSPLPGQGTVTSNWLMSGEYFEDEKYQVGIITIHFLR